MIEEPSDAELVGRLGDVNGTPLSQQTVSQSGQVLFTGCGDQPGAAGLPR
ncbi:MAG: hypothetical protein ACRDRI_08005 [Pseudonocardiaceae bacterium]